MQRPTSKLEYFLFTYAGNKADCEARLARASGQSPSQQPPTADSVLFDMWSRFGATKSGEGEENAKGGVSAEAGGNAVATDSSILGTKRSREPNDAEQDTEEKKGAKTVSNTTLVNNTLFPYPAMKMEHLASIQLVAAAYKKDTAPLPASTESSSSSTASSVVPTASTTSYTLVGCCAMVFCPIGPSASMAREAYMQLLWVDPSHRNNGGSNKGGGSNGSGGGAAHGKSSQRIGSAVLEMALAASLGVDGLFVTTRHLGLNLAKLAKGEGDGRSAINAANTAAPPSTPAIGALLTNTCETKDEKDGNVADEAKETLQASPPPSPSSLAFLTNFGNVTRCRLHTMVHRPLPKGLLVGGGVATQMLRDREANLARYFGSTCGVVGDDEDATAMSDPSPSPRPPTAGEITQIVHTLYTSHGFSERKHAKGYYGCTMLMLKKDGGSAAVADGVRVEATTTVNIRPDAVEMIGDKKTIELALRARDRANRNRIM